MDFSFVCNKVNFKFMEKVYPLLKSQSKNISRKLFKVVLIISIMNKSQ